MITMEELMDVRSLDKQGYSHRRIAKLTGLHRNTVKKYLAEGTLPVYKKQARLSKLAPYHGMIADWLSTQDYLATKVYDLLQLQGYANSYDIVRRYVKRVKEERDRTAYIRFETLPGQQAQVDFGDFQITNGDGTITTVYCFIMVLGYSRHMYVEFIDRCTMPNFLDCHQNAFGFFGGIPGEILYDNMKNVVIRRLAGAVQWNQTFAAFCAHCGFKPLATPPYSPWVKGKVERPIDYIRERFWRGYTFQNTAGANHDIREWLLSTAYRRIHGTTGQKVGDRFEQERPQLGLLPPAPFDTAEKVWRPVGKDCQISFGGNRYVVAHECVGHKVLLKVKDGIIRIFKDDQLIVIYQIPSGKGTTVEDPRFYARLKADREQKERKYRRLLPGKAKATRGLVNDSLNYQVMVRSLSVYDQLIGKEELPCPN
ncbi:MAG: IS21 family transposase [Candidatus Margulisiibacteriota bacterium]